MDNPLLKYSAKEYFFKASLCHFIVDELNAKASSSLGGSVSASCGTGGSCGRSLTLRVSTDRRREIRGDVPGVLRLQRVQTVEGKSSEEPDGLLSPR